MNDTPSPFPPFNPSATPATAPAEKPERKKREAKDPAKAKPALKNHAPKFDLQTTLAAAKMLNEDDFPMFEKLVITFDEADIDDHSGFMGLFTPPDGIMHHALDDALCQANAVCAARRIIKTG